MSLPLSLRVPLADRAFISVLDLFKPGIGPSSSHTVGPLRAAAAFAAGLSDPAAVTSIECTLFGSLGSTGVGHGTPDAVLAGLAGHRAETVTRDDVERARAAADAGALPLDGRHPIALTNDWLRFAPREIKPRHPNALTLVARDADGHELASETYYSIGGGFVEREGDVVAPGSGVVVPHRFDHADELLALCRETGLSISGIARENEAAVRTPADTDAALDQIWAAMSACLDAGLSSSGVLPGGLRVPRRAAAMAERLRSIQEANERDCTLEWLQAYAIAVNEENAAGGRVVTAPTNGAAGIIPAVLRHALDVIPRHQLPGGDEAEAARQFLLVAGVVGALIKSNASISGAEAGCQGEVGSAASMAAAGFAHLLGGSTEQVENAAEIAMEHSLGLTCDPVAGLVQLPCIERNAIGAGKAVAAARMAMHGDGTHLISLDTVIRTMRQTGEDMSRKYKETSEGGLAVNYVEC
ncbi:L-serine ammonia-lyase [Microcella flavibacter]|uniref:L-serine ammonia-lyase n=1 Tax=Microcella flavibacter TaxID=1804990 RepID=UPI001E4B3A81|nr:L-serine ammonia-lyase [Microcella flavibacter]